MVSYLLQMLVVKKVLILFLIIIVCYICDMKFYVLMFSIYMIAGALIPCNDVNACSTSIVANFTCDDCEHPNHESEGPVCSQFCVCACCGQIVQIERFHSSLDQFGSNLNSHFSKSKTGFISEIALSIWQPPKIS